MLRGLLAQPLKCFEVLDRGCAAEVEQVLPGTDEARPLSFARSDVGERVLHRRTEPQGGTP